MGPVSVELPIDVQAAEIDLPHDLSPVQPLQLPQVDESHVDYLVSQLQSAKRAVFWVGGGALDCVDEIKAIADLGIPWCPQRMDVAF